MARTTISEAELLKQINDHLAQLHDCRNLTVTSLVSDPARQHGGNWLTHGLQRSGADHDQVACWNTIDSFMTELQNKYDVSW